MRRKRRNKNCQEKLRNVSFPFLFLNIATHSRKSQRPRQSYNYCATELPFFTVCLCVTAHRRMRTITNYFLVNLSVADLMMSLLNCAFNFIFLLNSNWPFGVVYCTINNFVAHVTVASSVFTLVVISFDR